MTPVQGHNPKRLDGKVIYVVRMAECSFSEDEWKGAKRHVFDAMLKRLDLVQDLLPLWCRRSLCQLTPQDANLFLERCL